MRLLGRGGNASVYLAYDPRFERQVALKVLPHEYLHEPTFQERFSREARTIARLEHYAIVPVYDFGEHMGQPYLVMRYMSGGSLADRLTNGPLPLTAVAPILKRLADALDYSHSHGVVHRDLKPGNILFDNEGNAFLADFGIAKLMEATLTLTGDAFIGTPAYMSPEQVQGGGGLDGRSDIYTLGVILFQMLTGDLPYKADTPVQQLMAHVLNPVPNILEFRQDLPPQCEAVIAQAMAKSREDRYRTAARMAAVVEEIAHTETPPAPELEPPTLVEPAAALSEKTEVLLPDDPEMTQIEMKTAVANAIPAAIPVSREPAPASTTGPLAPMTEIARQPAAEPELPPAASARRRRAWPWFGLAAVALVLLGGGWLLWGRGGASQPPSAATGPASAETSQPLGQFIQQAWQDGYDVTSLAYRPGQWGVVLSDGAGYGRQTWHAAADSPLPKIEELWSQGFEVTDLAYGNGRWVVVLSTEAGLGQQLWYRTSDSPKSYIEEQWQKGYDVTSLAYGDGAWAVVMSESSDLGRQLWRLTSDSPRPFIEENWANGYDVTSLAYGEGVWAVIMSENSGLGQQLWQRTSASPLDFMQDKWRYGYDVTSLTSGDEGWGLIMSQDAHLGRQLWHTTSQFTTE